MRKEDTSHMSESLTPYTHPDWILSTCHGCVLFIFFVHIYIGMGWSIDMCGYCFGNTTMSALLSSFTPHRVIREHPKTTPHGILFSIYNFILHSRCHADNEPMKSFKFHIAVSCAASSTLPSYYMVTWMTPENILSSTAASLFLP